MKDIHANSSESLREQKAKGRVDHFRRAIFGLLFSSAKPMTDREVMEALKEEDVNNIRPEITRLKQDGMLEEVDKVRCPRTGKSVRRCRALLVPYRDRVKR